jgi:ATP-dependent DNA helicase 2 subunit 2
MAEKEATIFVIDLGKTMGEKHSERSVSDLEWAMPYVWDRITNAVRLSFCYFSRMIS